MNRRFVQTAGAVFAAAAFLTVVTAVPASAEKAVCIYYNPYTGEYSNAPFEGVTNQTYYDPGTGTYSNSC
ncbi:hypothetical protein [Streptomyces sp. SID13726]|uniref:hypothetical protein n=1 Tax=Streptomyces sp. SID13726 TaxID=2706058 RepID=UPI0013BD1A9C|nr:hypothetical protein [Streptomyces sp. SID13726]NEA97627.1 hypothetical protein [Streptomyces sp. SID13726]